ncbi:MAG: hypothetical protein AAFN10_28215, partial [Bacteroidota bacterium]
MAKLPWQTNSKSGPEKSVFNAFLEGDDKIINSFYQFAKRELSLWLSAKGISKSVQSDLIQEAMITLFKKIRDYKIQAENTPSILAYLIGFFLVVKQLNQF